MSNKDIAKSVRQKLLNKARSENRPFGDLLLYYGIERFLYRLSLSRYRNSFFLKGALMFFVWHSPTPRPTKDIDFLGQTDNSITNIENIIKEICEISYEPDGIKWLPESINAVSTQRHKTYNGIRVNFRGKLDTAVISMQIDIGFADAIYPKPAQLDYPALLDMPNPKLLGYTPESVIAEKVHSVFTLGELNSRLKDYFDIWFLSQQFEFDGAKLHAAIVKTFTARNLLPEAIETPNIFAKDFSDQSKITQWESFLKQSKLEMQNTSFAAVLDIISNFILPVVTAIKSEQPFSKQWNKSSWI